MFLLFKIILAFGTLHFHINFRICFSIFNRKKIIFFHWHSLKMQFWGRTDILKTSRLPVHLHDITLYLFKSSLFLSIVLYRSQYKGLTQLLLDLFLQKLWLDIYFMKVCFDEIKKQRKRRKSCTGLLFTLLRNFLKFTKFTRTKI